MNEIDYRALSKAAYGKTQPGRQVRGYELVNDLTSPDRVVYKHNETGHVVIAFRGTQSDVGSNRWRDWGTDLLMGFQLQGLGTRFSHAEQVAEKAIQRYGKENVSVTGHSLGGSQALHVSRKFDIAAQAYNPYVHSADVDYKRFPKAVIHHNISDPVSWRSMFVRAGEKRYAWKGWGLSAHGI